MCWCFIVWMVIDLMVIFCHISCVIRSQRTCTVINFPRSSHSNGTELMQPLFELLLFYNTRYCHIFNHNYIFKPSLWLFLCPQDSFNSCKYRFKSTLITPSPFPALKLTFMLHFPHKTWLIYISKFRSVEFFPSSKD